MSNPDEKWFLDRPRKVKTCPSCRGCGKVDEGYALHPAPGPVLDSPNEAIRAIVIGSHGIFEACREASDIARRSGEPVAFEFIDHTVAVWPESDPDRVARDWWRKQYGETPEQSAARR